MAGLAPVLAAVDTHSTAYGVGQIVGKVLVISIAVLVVGSILRRKRPPIRLKAVLLAIGGVLVALTVVGELLLAGGLTR